MSPTLLPPRQPPVWGSRPVEAVQRAMEVLRLFIDEPPGAGITVTKTASALHVSKSTVSRLLGTLTASGLLIVDPDTRSYHVGPLAFVLGTRFKGAGVARAVAPLMKTLAEETGCTAQLGTLQGEFVVYLSVAQSNQRLRVIASPGDIRHAHGSAVGKAILASFSVSELNQFMDGLRNSDGLLPTLGPGSIVHPADLERDLEITRNRGYSLSDEESATGVAALGVLVPSHRELPLAVSIAFATGLRTEAEYSGLVETLRTVAKQISDLLVLKGNDSVNLDVLKGS